MQDEGLDNMLMMFVGVMMLGRNGDDKEVEENSIFGDDGKEEDDRDGGIFSWLIIDDEVDNDEPRVRKEDSKGVTALVTTDVDIDVATTVDESLRGDNGVGSLDNSLRLDLFLYFAQFLLF
jgi:hypothetical protein